jgi:hypothetical protein
MSACVRSLLHAHQLTTRVVKLQAVLGQILWVSLEELEHDLPHLPLGDVVGGMVFQDRLVQVGPRLLLQSLLILCTPESVRVYPAFGEAPLLVTIDFITKLLPPQRDHVAGARLKHGCLSLERSEAVKSQPISGLNPRGLYSRLGRGSRQADMANFTLRPSTGYHQIPIEATTLSGI